MALPIRFYYKCRKVTRGADKGTFPLPQKPDNKTSPCPQKKTIRGLITSYGLYIFAEKHLFQMHCAVILHHSAFELKIIVEIEVYDLSRHIVPCALMHQVTVSGS